MKAFKVALAACLLAAGLAPALAHHSASQFDFRQLHELTGQVKAIRVINPHMSMTLAVTDQKGMRAVDFEGHSINNFYRAGWRPNMIKIGDQIKVRFAPRKDGTDGGFVSGFVTAQGKDIQFKIPTEADDAPASGKPGSGE
jgi:hypothetical protein